MTPSAVHGLNGGTKGSYYTTLADLAGDPSIPVQASPRRGGGTLYAVDPDGNWETLLVPEHLRR